MKETMLIAEHLREWANKLEELERSFPEPPTPQTMLEAVRLLREHMAGGELNLALRWGDRARGTDGIAMAVDVADNHYTTIGRGATVAEAVENALRSLKAAEPPPPVEEALAAALVEPDDIPF